MRWLAMVGAAAILGVAAMSQAEAQRGRPPGFQRYFGNPDDFYRPPEFAGNPEYDGHFVFARIKYRGFEHFGPEGPGWSHDYPRAEYDFTRILRDITIVNPFVEKGNMVGGVIVALDDPLLFRYPVSYMSEPGGWNPNERELAAFRSYLLKGGFMIFDDFREGWRGQYDWSHLKQIVSVAMPKAKWIQLTGSEPIFDAFFKIDLKLTVNGTSAYGTEPPTYWGIYENNDPKKRLMLVANVDNDIGESWQWSASGFVPITSSNELYKLGINYIIYALTH